MSAQEFSPLRPQALDALKQRAQLDEMPKDEDQAIEWLFRINGQDRESEERELGTLLKLYEQTLATQREDGKHIQLGSTLQETFQNNRIDKAALAGDGLIHVLPREVGASLIVVSDLHGHRDGLELAIRKFLKDPQKNHLASLGDMYTFGPTHDPPAAVSVLKALLKLSCIYPDRVHLLRGNNETDIAPAGGWSESIYAAQGDKGMVSNALRSSRVMRQLPLVLVTENGIVAVHGNLPGPRTVQGKSEFRNLSELAETIKSNSRSVFRLIWREKVKSATQTKDELLGIVTRADEEDVLGALNAVAGKDSVELVGHQHSFSAEAAEHPGYRISHDDRVATMVSLPNGEKREGAIAKIPLDQPITKMDDSFFVRVPYH